MEKQFKLNLKSLLCILIVIINVSIFAKEPDLNSVISRYERLHLECQKDTKKHDSECFKVYLTLASLYYMQEFNNYQSKAKIFMASHPNHYDSLYFVDFEDANFPKFENSLKIYSEIISNWGEDKLTYKDFKTYAFAMYFSTYYSKAIKILDKIMNKFSGEEKIDECEWVLNDCYISIGEYDTATVMINNFIKKNNDNNKIKLARETLDNIGNIKKYSKPKK